MAKAPLSIDLSALPEEHRATVLAALTALSEENERLKAIIAELERLVYGKRSEKLSVDEREQATEDLETACSEAEEATVIKGAPRQPREKAKRNLGSLPADLPRIETVIEPDVLTCSCGCGEMRRIGEDRTERIDIIPAQIRVIATVRPKYACAKCSSGVAQAPAPAHLIEGALPTEGTLAHVAIAKYADHCPLYRQSQILSRSGLDLHRSTLANWMGKVSFHIAPVVDCLAEHLKSSTKLFMDETRAPVLDPGRGRTKTGFLWALARNDRAWSGDEPPGVVYFYAPGRDGEYGEEFLDGFNGILQVDGYSGYNRLTKATRKGGEPITLAFCWAHARRKLKEVYDRDGSPIAREGLDRIAQFYEIEAEIRGLPLGQRLSARTARTAPLVAEFRVWLDEQRSKVSAKSRLGEKLGYIHRHWEGLQQFLKDGRVEMDSNNVENLIRPLALNRKNALFAGHDEGGVAWGRVASLIETAKINGVEPFAYLKATLEKIANGHPAGSIDELLPWNFVETSTQNP